MKTNTCDNKKKARLRDMFTAVLITALAVVLFIGTFALVGCDNSTQRVEQHAGDNQNMIASCSVALATNNDIATIDDMADFQMTLDRNTVSATWNIFTYVGWTWKMLICEGSAADYWKVMAGKNHQEITLKMTSKEFTYDLSSLVSSGKLSATTQYSIALYGVSNDGSMFQGSNVITYFYQAPATLPPNPTKEGHTFVGWYYGSESSHGSSCKAYDNAPIYSDTALHAHFTINTYKVTFESSGGSDVAVQTVNWNTSASLTTPERVGYRFLGWYLTNGTQYTNQPITANTTLTARWEIITYTVTFYVDNEVYRTLTVEYGATLQSVAERANMTYYNLYNEYGAKMSRSSVVNEDIEVNAVAMTNTEKATAFLANTWWALLLAVGGVALIIVAIVYTVKRGARDGK